MLTKNKWLVTLKSSQRFTFDSHAIFEHNLNFVTSLLLLDYFQFLGLTSLARYIIITYTRGSNTRGKPKKKTCNHNYGQYFFPPRDINFITEKGLYTAVEDKPGFPQCATAIRNSNSIPRRRRNIKGNVNWNEKRQIKIEWVRGNQVKYSKFFCCCGFSVNLQIRIMKIWRIIL